MKIIVYINFILTLLLIGGFIWIVSLNQVKNQPAISSREAVENTIQYVDNCGTDCKAKIDQSVSAALSTVSGQTKEIIKTVTLTPAPVKLKTQYSYIGISGPISTTSSDWYDAPGTDFYLDFNSDYGKNAVASWDAYLSVAHGNGTAYARLFDVTHGIAVNGSEVSVTDNANLTQVISGNLSFWSGKNLYRVQVRSLNTFEIIFGSGRIKINY